MVVFQTLLLGLVFGVGPVRVVVTPPVTTVEIQLDGVSLGIVKGEPWEQVCNFGSAPLPHELVAIGRDATGKEITRVRQWINLPKANAEARLVVNSSGQGQALTASLFWNTISNTKPEACAVTLDGVPITVTQPEQIELPGVDLKQTHFLTAEVRWPKGVFARAETIFGGEVKDQATTGLTAVQVILWPGETLPPIDRMRGWFSKGDKPLKVVAVEEGDKDVVFVFDQACKGRFEFIDRCSGMSGAYIPYHRGANRLFGMFGVRQTAKGASKNVRGLFPITIPLDLDFEGMCMLLRYTRFPFAKPKEQALANAAATAGLQAASLNRRRAVVLFIAGAIPDASTFSVTGALSYLESLNVPLFVWSPVPNTVQENLPGWGYPEDITIEGKFIAAKTHLENLLNAQRIIWLEGSHLPSSILLDQNVKQISLARGIFRQPRHTSK